MSIKRFKFIVSVYLIYIKKGKILLLRRYNTGYKDGYYSLPAGHLDEHEPLTQAIAREIDEEIGLDSSPKDYVLTHIMHRKELDERVDLFFVNPHLKGKPRNNEPDKCDDLRWFPINSLPRNTVPYIRLAISHHLSGVFYSEIGWI